MKAGGSQRELELLQATAKKQKEQILQLQDLLVSREQEHRYSSRFKCSSYSLFILFVCASETETLLVLDRERSLDYTFLKFYFFIWYSFFNV